MFEIRVECPECGEIWMLPQGSPGTYCNCHLVCPDGTIPQDCDVTQQNYSGRLNWPFGLHNDAEKEGEDVLHRTYYCSVHELYYYKQPVWIEANWEQWRSKRAAPRLRMGKGNY